MTESEWLAADDPKPMLTFLRGTKRASDRKLRLFATACCRRVWHLIKHERCRVAIEVAEQFADGKVSQQERRVARSSALDAFVDPNGSHADWAAQRVAAKRLVEVFAGYCWESVGGVPEATVKAAGDYALYKTWRPGQDSEQAGDAAQAVERRAQAAIVRDVFGLSPFRDLRVDPAWLAESDSLVTKLAQAAYDDRLLPSGNLDPVRLTLVADALEDVGYTDAEMLGHLRGPGTHYRGCWPVDLLLGKS